MSVDVEGLRRLLAAAASPPPWHWNESMSELRCEHCPVAFATNIPPDDPEPLLWIVRTDAEMLVAAVNSLPDALSELTQLRALRDAVKAWGVTLAEEAAADEEDRRTCSATSMHAWSRTVDAELTARQKLGKLADGLTGEEGKRG